ncbi:3-deoxy-8-phosphooctulonate synthase [Aquicella lusitana]|uniref:2-dehydro-3-deoxyphosphooctonate aldolase n=1 Tax=Aquicella lusitana TaxID=254246 RepID=A0A370G5H7_9COXI|nr:3-deoxy-8-phosphooctulonate synthase [Aquicella lusitana]RDI39077.1 2-dehydro-3-deoxyphosphooctonate aldolase (KDO 8-P synthase) [Aquicella lusitana]VVC73476.1 2-dehydro-3-deoxyphosphooctonate aldolase [Aquicella lusitana]
MKLCSFKTGLDQPFFLIAGPCVIESEQFAIDTAGELKAITQALGIPFIYKSSFDKANRTSQHSYRGPGMEAGLRILDAVKKQLGVPVLTDVHEDTPIEEVASVVDVLQTPAFLCRQTNYIRRVAEQGLPVNIKKGQFLSPWEMKHVVDKARETGNAQIMVCERGASFGYNNLVSDMRSLAVMRETGCPVVFDATHSVQLPGGGGTKSSGQRQFVPVLARAAIAAGVAGIFMETHPNPDQAPSDGPNMWPLQKMRELLETLKALDAVVKQARLLEAE